MQKLIRKTGWVDGGRTHEWPNQTHTLQQLVARINNQKQIKQDDIITRLFWLVASLWVFTGKHTTNAPWGNPRFPVHFAFKEIQQRGENVNGLETLFYREIAAAAPRAASLEGIVHTSETFGNHSSATKPYGCLKKYRVHPNARHGKNFAVPHMC